MWLKIALGARIFALNHGQSQGKNAISPRFDEGNWQPYGDKYRAIWCTLLIPA